MTLAVCAVCLCCLAFLNLTRFPATWFDEGSHLHVPKTLVTLGEYADYSDGELRYYGPTVGVGPTVMLPVAVAFKLAGVGLLQARVVMAVYLLIAVSAFCTLAYQLGGARLMLVSTLLLVTAPSLSLIENGRQVLGEVPGLAFLSLGLTWWFACWRRPQWAGLLGASVVLALACITKHVYLISILPGLLVAAGLNLIYDRRLPHLVFAMPIVIVTAIFGAWQFLLIAGLGPGSAASNLRLLQEATRGAALVFSFDNMRRAAGELLSIRALAGLVPAAILWTGRCQLSRNADQRWGVVWLMASANLAWYVLASAGWPRYAFAGLALSCLLTGRLLIDLCGDLTWNALWSAPSGANRKAGIAIASWAIILSLGFLGATATKIARPPYPAAQRMAEYLNAHVPKDRVIHTWEPEMSILSQHRYRFPPPSLLIVAVAHQWTGGPPVTDAFDFEQTGKPDYVLQGPFSSYVQLYPREELDRDYQPLVSEGGYVLFQRRPQPAADRNRVGAKTDRFEDEQSQPQACASMDARAVGAWLPAAGWSAPHRGHR